MKKLAFNEDGRMSEGKRNFWSINGVAKRLSVLLLNGPVINPSISGITAEEAKKDVNKKSASLYFFRSPEINASKPELKNAARRAIKTAGMAAQLPSFAKIIPATNPPRYICPSPPKFKLPDFIENAAPVPAIM